MSGGPLVIDTSVLLAVLFAEDEARAYTQMLHSATRLRISAPTDLTAAVQNENSKEAG